MILQYEGTRYQGWQKQDSTDNTIQGKLEGILKKMTGKEITVQGSGRTDAGVHAYGQVANFVLDSKMPPKEIRDYFNRYLPEDIAVISLETAPARFHSRLNAKGKTYCYRVTNSAIPQVFTRRYIYEFPETLDLEEMKKAAENLCGTHDFKAFTSNRRSKKTTVRTIQEIKIEIQEGEIRFTFTGDGFLYHMIRILVGTLLEVGTGVKKPEDMLTILEKEERENAGPLVPAKGLALMKVQY